MIIIYNRIKKSKINGIKFLFNNFIFVLHNYDIKYFFINPKRGPGLESMPSIGFFSYQIMSNMTHIIAKITIIVKRYIQSKPKLNKKP